MAINNFYMSVNLGGSPTNPGQATTYQIVTPWGQSDVCTSWKEALNQAFYIGSEVSGRQGMYFSSGTTNGIGTASQTVPTSANAIRATS